MLVPCRLPVAPLRRRPLPLADFTSGTFTRGAANEQHPGLPGQIDNLKDVPEAQILEGIESLDPADLPEAQRTRVEAWQQRMRTLGEKLAL